MSNTMLQTVELIRCTSNNNFTKMCVSVAPGKKDRKWNRNLLNDLSLIKSNHFQVIVCLLEWSELDKLQMLEYPKTAQQHNIIFYHLQVKDCTAPKQKDLKVLVPLLIQHMELGDNILVHCRAGLGRAGTICACCLCYLGYDPITAIRLIRERRPGAIQTISQENAIVEYYTNL